MSLLLLFLQSGAATNAAAGLAAGTGTAETAAVYIETPAELASATGAAQAVVATVSGAPAAAAGTGAAEAPSVWITLNAGVAEGTGAAGPATVETTGATTPTWTAPTNGAHMIPQPELKFLIPAIGDGIHFWLELDTANSFDTGALRQYKTDASQAGWAYWSGSDWTDLTAAGVPSAYAGNEARFTVPTELTDGTWYRRVKAGA